MALKESPTFYLASVVFQVEDTLFRVPRLYFERESEVFRAMFQLPVAADTVPDGSSSEHPLKLEGVDKGDFEQLLRVMFPDCPLEIKELSILQWSSALKLTGLWQMDRLTRAMHARISASNASFEDWMTLLDLSFRCRLPETRDVAIQKLSSKFKGGPIKKVLLGHKYNVEPWVRDGLRRLVQRQDALSDNEGDSLGLTTVLKLYRARNAYMSRLHSGDLRNADINGKKTGAVEEVEKEFVDLSEMNGELDHGPTGS